MPRILVLLLLATALAAGGCGGEDALDRARDEAQKIGDDLQKRIEQARADFEDRRDRFGKRIDEILAQFEQAVPQPRETSPVVRSRGNNEPQTIDAFLTTLLKDIDEYWTRTLTANDLPGPQVRYAWIPPGAQVLTACGTPAGDDAAFYCPNDDTIYVSQRFAADIYRGAVRGLPGEQAGAGRAVGDFAVAYLVAHEYAHNIQQELGIFDNTPANTAEPFELQADCFAGTWANSVYEQGELKPGDIEEAANAALAVGDFEFGNAQHHGTPAQRREALLTGFRSGDPGVCGRYLQQT